MRLPSYGVIYARLRAVMFQRIEAGCSIQPGDKTLIAEVLGIAQRKCDVDDAFDEAAA